MSILITEIQAAFFPKTQKNWTPFLSKRMNFQTRGDTVLPERYFKERSSNYAEHEAYPRVYRHLPGTHNKIQYSVCTTLTIVIN